LTDYCGEQTHDQGRAVEQHVHTVRDEAQTLKVTVNT
jgi:hypothetical protein